MAKAQQPSIWLDNMAKGNGLTAKSAPALPSDGIFTRERCLWVVFSAVVAAAAVMVDRASDPGQSGSTGTIYQAATYDIDWAAKAAVSSGKKYGLVSQCAGFSLSRGAWPAAASSVASEEEGGLHGVSLLNYRLRPLSDVTLITGCRKPRTTASQVWLDANEVANACLSRELGIVSTASE